MRLWHKDLIPYLPRQQLVSQWREVCFIANDWAMTGTPNHILVNEIMNYPIQHFVSYCNMIFVEMGLRGYRIMPNSLSRLNVNIKLIDRGEHPESGLIVGIHGWVNSDIYSNWHNDRYLLQCYFNLEEKYDRGGMSDDEWDRIEIFCSSELEYLL